METYALEWNEHFEFDIVKVNQLTAKEKEIFNYKDTIVSWFPKKSNLINDIVISNSMRPDNYTGNDALGLWEPSTKRIIIKRSQLKNIQSFAGTLVHELVHAHTNTDDNTIEFENKLTEMLGKLSTLILESSNPVKPKSMLKRLLNK